MNLFNKTLSGIYKEPINSFQKVNIRQYLTNKREPADTDSGISSAKLDQQTGIIEQTYLRKKILRRLAASLRIGYKK